MTRLHAFVVWALMSLAFLVAYNLMFVQCKNVKLQSRVGFLILFLIMCIYLVHIANLEI